MDNMSKQIQALKGFGGIALKSREFYSVYHTKVMRVSTFMIYLILIIKRILLVCGKIEYAYYWY
jgi:hypothetical protein